jgi:Tfp pilus assembly protein PilO
MRKITREQKKIYAVFAVVLVSLLVFIVFVYMPESKKLKTIKATLSDAEAKIIEITNIAQGKDLVDVVKNLDEQLKEIEDRLPKKSEDIIDDIRNEAKKLGIESKSESFSPGNPIKKNIPGYEIIELPIDMKLVCDYRALGEYIKALHSNNFPAVMRIEQIDIKGKGEGRSDLEVALHVIAYLEK